MYAGLADGATDDESFGESIVGANGFTDRVAVDQSVEQSDEKPHTRPHGGTVDFPVNIPYVVADANL